MKTRKTLHALVFAIAMGVSMLCFCASAHGQSVTIDKAQGYVLQLDRDSLDNYVFYGMLVHCDTIDFDVRGGAISFGADSTRRPLDGEKHVERAAKHPPCRTELFKFPVHGGVVRQWIEHDGPISFDLVGARYVIRFRISQGVRDLVKAVYGWTKI